jgi:hypothetical protein
VAIFINYFSKALILQRLRLLTFYLSGFDASIIIKKSNLQNRFNSTSSPGGMYLIRMANIARK